MNYAIGLYYHGDRIAVLPLEANLEHANEYEYRSIGEYDDAVSDGFPLLKAQWESQKWNYHMQLNIELIEIFSSEDEAQQIRAMQPALPGVEVKQLDYVVIQNPDETSECSEFEIIGYDEWMISANWYSTPWDSVPNEYKFCCYEAMDGMRGREYSKDFNYFDCYTCERTICEQNPANGWMSQVRDNPDPEIDYNDYDPDTRVCLKCYQDYMLEHGVNLEKVIETQRLPGMFFSRRELEDAGFIQVPEWSGRGIGMGYSTNYSEKDFFDDLKNDHDHGMFDNAIVLIDFDSMAIGGLGGYVTFWVKEKTQELKKAA